MKPLRRLPIAEQTAAHLIESLRSGRWAGALPGVNRLASELDVSRETVRAALRQLEAQGLLTSSGPGQSRQISTNRNATTARRSMRVGVLLNDLLIDENAEMQRTLLQLQQAIESVGHVCFFAAESQASLRHDRRRITRFVKATPADAWVVIGASSELLEWFASQPVPAIAVGGRNSGVPLAAVGGDVTLAISDAIHQLANLGHRRIVFITPEAWRKPDHGKVVRHFAAELTSHGITPGDYNLPDWEETPEGLQTLLRSLFHLTPPTALIVVEPSHAVATIAFLSQRGLQVGRDVSFLCMMPDPAFAWRSPPLAHFRWQNEQMIRRVVRWIGGTARGRPDRKQTFHLAEFDPGGTICPVVR